MGIAADITERKQIEQALAESEAKFRRLVEGGQDLVWSTDAQNRLTYLSPQVKALSGWEASEWLGKFCIEMVYPEDRQWAEQFHHVRASNSSVGSLEFRLLCREQPYIWVNLRSASVFDTEGNLLGRQGTITDITDRKTAELALQESQEQLRRLTENIPGMVFQFSLHPDGSKKFMYVSSYARDLYGMEPEEILSHQKSPWDIVHSDDIDRLTNTIEHSAKTLQPLVVEYRFKSA